MAETSKIKIFLVKVGVFLFNLTLLVAGVLAIKNKEDSKQSQLPEEDAAASETSGEVEAQNAETTGLPATATENVNPANVAPNETLTETKPATQLPDTTAKATETTKPTTPTPTTVTPDPQPAPSPAPAPAPKKSNKKTKTS